MLINFEGKKTDKNRKKIVYKKRHTYYVLYYLLQPLPIFNMYGKQEFRLKWKLFQPPQILFPD